MVFYKFSDTLYSVGKEALGFGYLSPADFKKEELKRRACPCPLFRGKATFLS
jgi:hypothetical protein